MVNVFINIYKEMLDFQEYITNIESIGKYSYSFDSFNSSLIDKFERNICKIKGDGFNIQSNFFNNNYYINLKLIFTKEADVVINDVISDIKKNMKSIFSESSLDEYLDDYNNLDKIFNIINDDGIILCITNDEVSLQNDYKVKELLNKNNLNFEVLNLNERRTEFGASGVFENFVFFILGSVASGLTWDTMKILIANNLNITKDNIKIFKFDNYNFKKMREIIADRIREDSKDIVLHEMYKQEDYILIVFKANDKEISIMCDENYNIEEIKVEENSI